jgi:DNA-binding NtrC family response regulator
MHTTPAVKHHGRRPRRRALGPAALVGESDAVRRAREILEQPGGGPLLILADEGLDVPGIARYVHERTRAGQPFVAVDCAQTDADALDATLFGVRSRAAAEPETLGAGSALLAARRGTVFLENVGDLPAALQRRLARVMRDGEVRVAVRDRVRIEARIPAAAAPDCRPTRGTDVSAPTCSGASAPCRSRFPRCGSASPTCRRSSRESPRRSRTKPGAARRRSRLPR